ncbi:YkgJ family cysteine cluster protein [Deinococcus sonorensis]|uniref:YkgJ family cysteine cluster protein n=2 Tax=Deinococcus sonorensis TaxID=309891 RepID=A0AAU7UE98_9DEIO
MTRPPDPLHTTLRTAYARYQRQAGRWLDGYTRQGGQVYCGAGCFRCCDMPIRVSLAEARLTASELTAAQLNGMRQHARKTIRNARSARSLEQYVERHRQEVGFCPLLDREQGVCTAYEVRPTRCRDTYSAFPARYCAAGALEDMTRQELQAYRREVRRTPGTDGESHYIAPLEELSEPVWTQAARAMRQAWGLEVWGDFWVLTSLATDDAFMRAVEAGQADPARRRARALGLEHPELLEFA